MNFTASCKWQYKLEKQTFFSLSPPLVLNFPSWTYLISEFCIILLHNIESNLFNCNRESGSHSSDLSMSFLAFCFCYFKSQCSTKIQPKFRLLWKALLASSLEAISSCSELFHLGFHVHSTLFNCQEGEANSIIRNLKEGSICMFSAFP